VQRLAFAGIVSIAAHTAILSAPLGSFGSPRDGSAPSRPSPLTASLSIGPQTAAKVVANSALAAAPLALPASPPLPYFKLSQLSEAPRPLVEPPLELLQSLVKEAGAIKMRLFIDEAGNVNEIDVESASLPPEATRQAVAIFSHVRFAPGRIGRFNVKSQMPISIGAVAQRSYDGR